MSPRLAETLMESPANQFDDLTGVSLLERYHIKGKLGQGGMGSVYVAHDDVLDRDVAIKTVFRNNLNDIELVRFHREAKAASTIRHPNVIQMLDFGVLESGQPFMVMELINGVSISGYIAEHGAVSPDLALKIVEQVAGGMMVVHRENIVHRDLKSSNILLVDTGGKEPLVRILDFGIAKSLTKDAQTSTLTKAGQIFGSPHYMSPEQIRGDELDARADVYSLGCILFEMLTGSTIFDGDTVMEIVSKHMTDPVPRLWEVSEQQFPMELERLVAHMVAKERDERFSSMDEVIDNIRHIQPVIDEFVEKRRLEALAAASSGDEPATFGIRNTALLVASLVIACGLLVGSIWAVSSIVLQPKNKIDEKQVEIDRESREKVVEQRSLIFDAAPIVEKQVEDWGVAIKHAGDATTLLKTMIDKKRKGTSSRDIYALTAECTFVPSDANLLFQLQPAVLAMQGAHGVDDNLVKKLSKVKSIRSLNLSAIKGISSEALGSLAALPNLQYLKIIDCDMTDAHLKAIRNCPQLGWLFVQRNRRISLSGVKSFSNGRLPRIVYVDQPTMTILPQARLMEIQTELKLKLVPSTHEGGADKNFAKFGWETIVGDEDLEKGTADKSRLPQTSDEHKFLRHLE